LKERLSDLFEVIFKKSVDFVSSACVMLVPCSKVQLARSLMGLLEAQLLSPGFLALLREPHARSSDIIPKLDMCFLYSLVWSVGAVTDEKGRREFSDNLRKATQTVHKLKQDRRLKFDQGCQIREGSLTAFDYYVDRARWASWSDKLRSSATAQDLLRSTRPSEQIIVPTTESLKITRLLELCVGSRLPVLLVGPTGTGKSVSV
jgi:dynein heavy chain